MRTEEKEVKLNRELKDAIPAILFWALSFLTDKKIFTTDGLNMNCLPIDTSMILPMHILTKICVLLFWIGIFRFLSYGWKHKDVLLTFVFFMAVYGVGLIITYPGYYMNDDPIIFAYATRYLPVYWHNYLTSLFYMTGISLFPASCGPVLLSDICCALVFTYLYVKGKQLIPQSFSGGKKILCCLLLFLPGILPHTLLGSLMCFRPAVYSSFFAFYFLVLFFDWREGNPLTYKKIALLAFLTALLSVWRSESIVLLVLALLLIPFAYLHESEEAGIKTTLRKRVCIFALLMLACYGLISAPQKSGEKKYYGSDYLILSTTRPLSVMVWRDQTYEGAEEDLANISAVTDFGYLHNDSLSCSAYNRYNSDHNEGRYTQTGADSETQKKYLKSAFRMILHNLDLYAGERIQLFLVTNGIFNYDPALVMNLKPVVANTYHLYEHDRDYGFEMLEAFKRIPLAHHEGYALFLYAHGGEAWIPVLVITVGAFFWCLFKKKWFAFFVVSSLLAREAVIFMTAPASFIQYSYPTMYTMSALLALWIIGDLGRKKS